MNVLFKAGSYPLFNRTAVCNLLFVLLIIPASRRAMALPTFRPVVTEAYTLKAGGKVDSARDACTLCHAKNGPPELNVYGKDVKVALETAHAKMLTPAILQSIGAKDSDGDGFTNAEEFAADTLPGDPASHPAKKTKATSVAEVKTNSAPPSLLDTLLKLAFPQHAQHPVLVHFPIGLFIISLLFDLIALRTRERSFAQAAYFNLVVATIGSVASVITGILAWRYAYGAAPLTGDLLYHLILGVFTMVMLMILLAMRWKQKDRGAPQSGLYFGLALLVFILISITGHLGGNLTHVNG